VPKQKPLWEAVADAVSDNPDNPGVPDMDCSDWAIVFRVIADDVAPKSMCTSPDDSWDASAITYQLIRTRLLTAARIADEHSH
jgi:hypothetical protein